MNKKSVIKIYKALAGYFKFRVGLVAKKIFHRKMKIIIGANATNQKGWLSTDIEFLNLIKRNDWSQYFQIDSIDAIIAEHVWEHLTLEEAKIACKNCYDFLRPGGYARISVPDGFHPDKEYRDYISPNPANKASRDHKIVYDYKMITSLFENAGFKVKMLEYFDEQGKFIKNSWDADFGYVSRSSDNDPRNSDGNLKYTSIIFDAYK